MGGQDLEQLADDFANQALKQEPKLLAGAGALEDLKSTLSVMGNENRALLRQDIQRRFDSAVEYAQKEVPDVQGLKDWLASDPVANYRGKMQVQPSRIEAGKRKMPFKSEREFSLGSLLQGGQIPDTITKKQAQILLQGSQLKPSSVNAQGRVPWPNVLDQLAQHFNVSEQELINRIEQIRKVQLQIADTSLLGGQATEEANRLSRILQAMDELEQGVAMAPSTSVQTGLEGFGTKPAQSQMLGEFGGAGTAGKKIGLIDKEALKAKAAARPLPGQIPAPEVPPVTPEAKAAIQKTYMLDIVEPVRGVPEKTRAFPTRVTPVGDYVVGQQPRQYSGSEITYGIYDKTGKLIKGGFEKHAEAMAAARVIPPVTPEVARINKEIDEIGATARDRIEKADLATRGLRPSEVDWMTNEERVRLEELKQQLPKVSQAEARARIEAKRLARREATPPVTPVGAKVIPKTEVAPVATAPIEGLPKPTAPPVSPAGVPSGGAFPPTPVVNAQGRLWLPEPPRTPEYMAFARKEMKGSFRKKTGVLDTIEQAHQQVLKARDMGTNAVNYVASYLRQAGDMTKEFGLDAQGMATRVVNPGNRSLAINDILSNPAHYTLTPAQKEIAKRHGFVYQEALKLAKSYGVEISELGGPDEFWQYIARRVKSKLNPLTGQYETPPSVTGGFRMGARISAQKERVFDEMAQGVDLGLLYEHPDQVAQQHIKGIYRLIGNKQAENTVKGLTRAITEEAPLVFGERSIAQPALRSRAAVVEVANAIDKIFTPEQEIQALRKAADISGAMVGQIAALDISAPFIQGLPVLGHDLKMGLKGKPSFVWGKAYGNMWKAVKNPETINTFRTQNAELYKRAIEAGVATGESEFVSGVPLTGRVLGKIPAVGKTLKEGYRQIWGRMGQAYSDFLEVTRIKLFEQMEGAWGREGGNIYDLGAVINRLSGTASAAARGVGANRRFAERILLFAPNYLRSSLLLIKDMIGRGAVAKEVQATIAAMLGVGFAFYYGEEKIRGREPKIKPWPKRLGGDGAEAFTTEINGVRVGLGSWMYGMIKMLAEVGAVAVDDPMALVKWNAQHPIVRFAKTKIGPEISFVTEMASGKNFWGQSFENPQDYLLRLAESVLPISVGPLIEKPMKSPLVPATTASKVTEVVTSLMGLRSFPASQPKPSGRGIPIGKSPFGQQRGTASEFDEEELRKRVRERLKRG